MQETDQESTALVHIAPNTDASVIALYLEAQGLLTYANYRTIATDDDVKLATDDLGIMSRLKKAIEARRREYTVPLNDHLTTINEAFKTFTAPLAEADSTTRAKVLVYRAEQARQRAEQERINSLREEAARAEMKLKDELTEPTDLVEVAPVQPAHYRTDSAMTGTVKRWKFEVEDFDALPNEYKLPDTTKIRKVVTAGASIPGVRAWQEDELRVTS